MDHIAPEDLATIEEAAEILEVPLSTLRRWRFEGTAPRATRDGRRLWFLRSEVKELAAERKARFTRAFAEQSERTA